MVDAALEHESAINDFLRQKPTEMNPLDETLETMTRLVADLRPADPGRGTGLGQRPREVRLSWTAAGRNHGEAVRFDLLHGLRRRRLEVSNATGRCPSIRGRTGEPVVRDGAGGGTGFLPNNGWRSGRANW
ncbi:MAG: hypothetical protein CM1200mP2_36790 [Planctomycetaceae bacterium]|nr:MAG: hypothetical protein CM1200mP2_36790 [Planctomycetaceae bacterium]